MCFRGNCTEKFRDLNDLSRSQLPGPFKKICSLTRGVGFELGLLNSNTHKHFLTIYDADAT